MAVFNEPSKWATNLGKDADVVTIPDTAGDTDPDIEKIFPAVFSIPLANGGKAVPRKVLNALFKLVGDWSFYYQNGGIASYSSDLDYVVGRVVLYTDGNLYKCIQANSSTAPKAPTDSAYWSKIALLSDFTEFGFNTGDIKIHTTSTVPNGWLLCNGAGISRTTFSNLFAEIGTTYGTGDGSTTFNIPDLRDRYIIGANANALGSQIAEQLPNIKGNWQPSVFSVGGTSSINHTFLAYEFDGQTSTANGALQHSGGLIKEGSAGDDSILNLNLSIANSIYTDNGKVYPASIALNFIIKT